MSVTVSHLVFVLGLVGYLGIRVFFQRRAAGRTKVVQASSPLDRLLVSGVVVGQIVLPVVYLATRWLDGANHHALAAAAWLGIPVLAGSLWLFWRSHADLGRNWSVALDLYGGHALVTDGVYRSIRHPMYAAFIGMGIAQALLLPNWIAGGAALVAAVLLYAVRTPNEEAMMIAGFGDDYRRYMSRTGGVIPRLRGRG